MVMAAAGVVAHGTASGGGRPNDDVAGLPRRAPSRPRSSVSIVIMQFNMVHVTAPVLPDR
uniref:Uncharacterized protein n=1 Tax=Oryza punctata TaxID=4537 RepID=A0A0E0MHW7_ORYPU